MTLDLYAASYAHRYSDPCGGYVGFTPEAVTGAIESAMQYEAEELRGYCEHESDSAGGCNDNGTCEDCDYPYGGGCSMCDADLVWYGVHRINHASDLGGLRRTIEYVRDARGNDGVTHLDSI